MLLITDFSFWSVLTGQAVGLDDCCMSLPGGTILFYSILFYSILFTKNSVIAF